MMRLWNPTPPTLPCLLQAIQYFPSLTPPLIFSHPLPLPSLSHPPLLPSPLPSLYPPYISPSPPSLHLSSPHSLTSSPWSKDWEDRSNLPTIFNTAAINSSNTSEFTKRSESVSSTDICRRPCKVFHDAHYSKREAEVEQMCLLIYRIHEACNNYCSVFTLVCTQCAR